MRPLEKFYTYLLGFLFPSFCVGCGSIDTHLCHHCYENIEFLPHEVPLKIDNTSLDECIAAANYARPLSTLIRHLKYHCVKEVAQLLGSLLYFTTNYPDADAVTCVPLHPKRQHDRGFNQAELLAQEFSQHTKLPFYNLLVRQRATSPQALVTDKELRKHHLDTAFTIHPNTVALLPALSTVIIIDDVATTGTTLNECAKVLKTHGIKRVIGLTVAHGN